MYCLYELFQKLETPGQRKERTEKAFGKHEFHAPNVNELFVIMRDRILLILF
jgi:hypothetical protein